MKRKGILCVACRDVAKTLRKGRPACRSCMRVSAQKWADGIEELLRIDASKEKRT